MSTNKSVPALDLWADDGGTLSNSHMLNDVPTKEQMLMQTIAQCLGNSVVKVWSNLPRDVQRLIFNHASNSKPGSENSSHREIARYLHDHKGT